MSLLSSVRALSLVSLTVFSAAQASAAESLLCKNADGQFQLNRVAPCKECSANTVAFDFIGGEGIVADGIPNYEADMPGYISSSRKEASPRDISLIDGGVWTIHVFFPEGFLTRPHASGETVKVSVDSSYDDISEAELNDVEMTCTVL